MSNNLTFSERIRGLLYGKWHRLKAWLWDVWLDWVRLYFHLWCRVHPRSVALLDERRLALAKWWIAKFPEHPVKAVKYLSRWDESQLTNLENYVKYEALRHSPLRNMMPRQTAVGVVDWKAITDRFSMATQGDMPDEP